MQKSYKWLPQYDRQIKKNWNHKASERLRGIMCKVREGAKDGFRPTWIPENVFEQLMIEWNSETFKKKQDKAKKNRASLKGGTLHSCGSIPAPEHKRRMVNISFSNK